MTFPSFKLFISNCDCRSNCIFFHCDPFHRETMCLGGDYVDGT